MRPRPATRALTDLRAPVRRIGLFVATLALWVAGPAVPSIQGDTFHQAVCYEGRVGPYGARISIRPPGVIPGLAEISVRVLEGQVDHVEALPIKWNTGKKGAPPPDVARPVGGETNLFSTELWFMEGGAHGVEVVLRGAAGDGQVLVPVNSVATRVLSLSKGLGVPLAVLLSLLVALLVTIVGAAVRESVLGPDEEPSRRRRWAARGATALAAVIIAILLWGGWLWWGAEAADYRTNRLYRPRAMDVAVQTSTSGTTLRLTLGEINPRANAPLVPDHGRWMHLFLMREPDLDAMAHLHPVRVNPRIFETALPALPDGTYMAYGQITHETGFSETLTNRFTLTGGNAGRARATDSEDAWTVTPAGPEVSLRSELGDGLVMVCAPEVSWVARRPASLGFRVYREGDPSAPVTLEPYLGMRGHLALRSRSGRVFSHMHPSGSFSMAAQQLLELREAGKAPRRVEFGANDPTCQLPSVEESTLGWLGQKPEAGAGTVSFPCEFPDPGEYRLWVQVRIDGRIRTGTFDVTVLDWSKAPRGS